MTKILFVCHGNICRSPMAEFCLRQMVEKAGIAHRYEIASAAVSREELGNGVYPPARRLLEREGISCAGKRARLMTTADYDRYDLLIGMDSANLRAMRAICGGDGAGKLRLLLDRDVADPWYTGDFASAWQDITSGCRALLHELEGC